MISANELQPPLVLPRRGDAGYLALLFPLVAMQVTLVGDKPMTVSLSMVSVPPLRGRLGGG